jgi:putative transposase
MDTLGNLIQVLVHAANEHESEAGYRGTAVEFVETALGLKLHISQRIKDAFAVLPTRWIVERTFTWLGTPGAWTRTLKY